MSDFTPRTRPAWCPHADCVFLRQTQDLACVGRLPQPEPHDGDHNTHRLCLAGVLAGGEVFDLQVNTSDMWNLERLFQAVKEDVHSAAHPAAPGSG